MSINDFPEETIQNIAARLEDRDLVRFRSSCRSVCAAIDARPAHFWMYRFKDHFDLPRKPFTLDLLRESYQLRRQALRSIPMFKHGTTPTENNCIRHLLDIILDASPKSINPYGVPYSKNFELLDNIVKTSNILQCIFERRCSAAAGVPMHSSKSKKNKTRKIFGTKGTILQVFQLLMSARSLSFITPTPSILSFDESQQAAYMDTAREPIFGGARGMEVNIIWALHIVNFFRYHMLRESEATLFPAFRDLSMAVEGTDMPQMWKKKLSNNDSLVPIGRNWKGSYAYLHRKDVNSIRKGKDIGSTVYTDHNVDLGHKAIQEMEINFPGELAQDFDKVWLSVFEFHLNGENFLVDKAVQGVKSATRNTRSNPAFVGPERPEDLKSQYFNGIGWDDENFHTAGWITQLPSQRTVPGFKRMVMMKYFVDSNNNIDLDALWAYEGVVLPGDQIIVGRWWSPEPDRNLSKIYSGPFILWNTDCGAKYREVQEASMQEDILLDSFILAHD